MSNRRYLEIDSTYRNRNQDKNPSNFTVLISQSGTRNATNAYDPISIATPIKTWVPSNLVLNGQIAEEKSIVNPLNQKDEIIISFLTTSVKETPDYYVGYPIKIQSEVDNVKITSWNLLSKSNILGSSITFTATVSPSLLNIPSGTVTFVSNINNYVEGFFFIPNGYCANFYYVGYILYNETKNEYRPIISYDGTLKIGGIDLSSQFGGLIPTWTDNDTYSIREKIPQYIGNTIGPAPYPFNQLTSFCVNTDIIVEIGDFIRFTTNPHENESFRVTDYNNTLHIVTVDRIIIPQVIANEPIEVLQFTRDNSVPFCYSGSLVSQQEMVCYEVELINLVLPNKLLISGGRISFYPYIYVELQNISGSSAGTHCIIYSNNPNSNRMLFKVAIDDISNPFISPFIKIDGGKMVQTIKFKPNDNFKFGVYLPNGDPFETVEKDTLSPVYPNPLLQVSALFQLKRL